ncbi:hypothetical protein EDB84DRAFT_1436793 [Lactarius hengduanensis]|nr:hypothetical protein EDB84DRAFT_1436793 [Lactarius hengduanensis]
MTARFHQRMNRGGTMASASELRFTYSNSESEGESDDPMSALVDPEYWKKKGLILGRLLRCGTRSLRSSMRLHADRFYGKFLLLIEVSPAVIKILKRAGERAGPELSLKLDKALQHEGYFDCVCIGASEAAQKCRRGGISRKQARRVDINGIPWYNWAMALYRLAARVPSRVREDLCRSTQDVGAADYPAFLWPQDIFTRSDFFKGFLRGPVLLAAYRYIFISPSAAKETDRSTRGGNLSLHGVTFVTYESVAVCCDGGGCATPGGKGLGSPTASFYRELLEHKGLMTEDELVDLLQYWMMQGAIMREQAREKKRLACGSAANAVTPAGLESGLPEPDSAST